MDSMLEQCIEFNKQRPNRLSEHVIRDKHSKLEISGLRIKP
jgi:predicted kinase